MRRAPTRTNAQRRLAWLVLTIFAVSFIAIIIGGLQSCGRKAEPSDAAPVTSLSETVAPTTSETTPTTETTTEPTTEAPTDTPTPTETPVPTDTPTPVPTDTPTPVPTDTPTPEPTATSTPTPKPTKTPEPTPSSTPTPTKEPEPTPSSTPVPPPMDTPTPVPADPTPTPDTGGRDYGAEQQAGIQHAKDLGYIVTSVGGEGSEYVFYFTNATGTYSGAAHIMSSKQWVVSYYPVDNGDPNATYGYTKRSNDIIKLLDGLDPAWLYYGR